MTSHHLLHDLAQIQSESSNWHTHTHTPAHTFNITYSNEMRKVGLREGWRRHTLSMSAIGHCALAAGMMDERIWGDGREREMLWERMLRNAKLNKQNNKTLPQSLPSSSLTSSVTACKEMAMGICGHSCISLSRDGTTPEVDTTIFRLDMAMPARREWRECVSGS